MRFAWEITEEDKTEYLELMHSGMTSKEAAEHIGTTGSVMRKFRSPNTQWYDEDFAAKYAVARRALEEAKAEIIDDAFMDLVRAGNAQAVIKGKLVYDPAWAVLRHQNLRVDVEVLARYVPYLTREELDRAIERAEGSIETGEVFELEPPKTEAA